MNLEVFKKFSPESRKVLITAQKYAQLTSTVLASDHLLMAIVVTPNSLAHKILKHIPLTVDQLRVVMGLQVAKDARVGLDLADELKQIIEQSAFVALKLESELIEVDHLMLGILSQKNSQAYWLIVQAGVEPDVIKKHLESHLAGTLGSEPQAKNTPTKPPSFPIPNIEIMGFMGDGPSSAFGMPPDMSALERLSEMGFEDDAQDEPTALARLTTDLTALATSGGLDPVIGRTAEIEQVVNILGRKTKNNPVLVGDPGVGKTAIAEGLALKIASGEAPYFLDGAKVYSLELSSLVAGTMYRGQFEERLKDLVEDLKAQKNAILFIDEVHTLVGAGGAEGSLDAANILKPALAKGNLRLIGATTPEEFRKHIKKDSALSRRLQVVKVEEPSAEDTLVILEGIRNYYQKFHGVKISDAFLRYAVQLADRFLKNRFFPDKAIDLIDEASARARALQKTPKHILQIRDLKETIKELELQKAQFISKNLAKEAHGARAQIATAKAKIKTIKKQAKKLKTLNAPELKPEILEDIVASWTGVPVQKLTVSQQRHFASLERNLTKKIIGQKSAVKKIANSIKMAKSGLSGDALMGSFMLVGPTGVGKTFTAKVIAQEVFGSEKAIIKLDMSEFSQPHQVARLIGAPPGYVGFGEANIFGEKIRANPYQVILFDEIEKAHPDIFNILLQIMDEGKLTDANDEEIDFRHSLILFSSNIGAELWTGQVNPGFNKKQTQNQSAIMSKLKEYFRPEFLARLSDVVVYSPLDTKSLAKILDIEIIELEKTLASKALKIKIPQNVKKALLSEILNSKEESFRGGARGIKRIVQQQLLEPIAHHILVNPKQAKIEFVLKEGMISIKKY